MADFVITTSTYSVLVEINGKQASFSSGDIHPYTANGVGDTVYIYDTVGIFKSAGLKILSMPQLSRDRIPIVIGVDTIDVDGTTSFADADTLLAALQAVFFLASPPNPLIPEDYRVDTFVELPDPIIHNGQYWIVDQSSGTWVLGTRKEAGIYKAVAGAWVYRGVDIPYYLQDDQFTIKDSGDATKQLGFEVATIGTGQRRVASWQDRNGIVEFKPEALTLATNTILTAGSKVINITAEGITLTLFATPTKTDEVNVFNESGGAVVVDGNGNNVYDSPSQNLLDGENFNMVFNNSKWNI